MSKEEGKLGEAEMRRREGERGEGKRGEVGLGKKKGEKGWAEGAGESGREKEERGQESWGG